LHRKLSESFYFDRFSTLIIYEKDFDDQLDAIAKENLSVPETEAKVKDALVAYIKKPVAPKEYTREEAFFSIMSLMENAAECIKQRVCDKMTAINLLGPIAQTLYDPCIFYIEWNRGCPFWKRFRVFPEHAEIRGRTFWNPMIKPPPCTSEPASD
jgi:hypothetical protein